MKQNLGTIDRVVRTILGISILAAGYFLHSYWGMIGLVPLLTAVVGFCPAYCPLRITTCKDCRK